MTSLEKIRAVQAMFDELLKLIGAEGRLHYYPWLKIGYSLSCQAESDPAALADLKVLVRGVHTGAGGFFDLVLTRTNRQEMIAVNDRLDQLREGVLRAVQEL